MIQITSHFSVSGLTWLKYVELIFSQFKITCRWNILSSKPINKIKLHKCLKLLTHGRQIYFPPWNVLHKPSEEHCTLFFQHLNMFRHFNIQFKGNQSDLIVVISVGLNRKLWWCLWNQEKLSGSCLFPVLFLFPPVLCPWISSSFFSLLLH